MMVFRRSTLKQLNRTLATLNGNEQIHHISKVTQEFIDFLANPLEIKLSVSPYVQQPKDKIGTKNQTVMSYLKDGYKPKSETSNVQSTPAGGNDAELQKRIAELQAQNEDLQKENTKLKAENLLIGRVATNKVKSKSCTVQ